jgi:predicted XRE-type DNA-binding protein
VNHLLSEMEQLLQDFREAQQQLIDELKVTQPEYADKMILKLQRKEAHYKSIINKEKANS